MNSLSCDSQFDTVFYYDCAHLTKKMSKHPTNFRSSAETSTKNELVLHFSSKLPCPILKTLKGTLRHFARRLIHGCYTLLTPGVLWCEFSKSIWSNEILRHESFSITSLLTQKKSVIHMRYVMKSLCPSKLFIATL